MDFKVEYKVVEGEFYLTLEDVAVLTGLPIFGESRAIVMPGDLNVKLHKEGEIRLGLLRGTF